MKKISHLILLFVSLMALPSMANERVLVLTEEWVPFNFSKDNEIVGISTELVKATLEHANVSYDMQLLPWKRAYKTTLKHKNTLLFTTNRIAPRESLFKWIGPLYRQDVTFYRLLSRDDIKADSIEDLKKYKMGVARGGSVEGYLKANGFVNNVHYFSYESEEQGERMLMSNRIDLIPTSKLNVAYRRSRNDLSLPDICEAYTIAHADYYIAVNKETPDELVDKIQRSLDVVVKSGFRDRVTRKYIQQRIADKTEEKKLEKLP
ncbi:substrate-binding periplasmic protein [Aliikangiella coralliicola]|uniref:ABC transporter substrate-binding protein n=1 Tax=Aliikangiella coralliicola TaxID=2592383 RepID=A0A545U5Z0_9GAMM|nr:ABC transporter substrate-binding protein [Aliikangiella coralliicola]TQV84888.1 ABC transporter substrate-binding protein [Aliikangiella coralliicola]